MAQYEISKYHIEIRKWTTDQLIECLHLNGLYDCCDAIKNRNIDGDDFLNLNEANLKFWRELNIVQVKRLWSVIQLALNTPKDFIGTKLPISKPKQKLTQNVNKLVTQQIPRKISPKPINYKEQLSSKFQNIGNTIPVHRTQIVSQQSTSEDDDEISYENKSTIQQIQKQLLAKSSKHEGQSSAYYFQSFEDTLPEPDEQITSKQSTYEEDEVEYENNITNIASNQQLPGPSRQLPPKPARYVVPQENQNIKKKSRQEDFNDNHAELNQNYSRKQSKINIIKSNIGQNLTHLVPLQNSSPSSFQSNHFSESREDNTLRRSPQPKRNVYHHDSSEEDSNYLNPLPPTLVSSHSPVQFQENKLRSPVPKHRGYYESSDEEEIITKPFPNYPVNLPKPTENANSTFKRNVYSRPLPVPPQEIPIIPTLLENRKHSGSLAIDPNDSFDDDDDDFDDYDDDDEETLKYDVIQTEDNYRRESWFRNVNRQQASTLLRGKPNGTFIARPSQQQDHECSLSVACENRIYNLAIVKSGDKLMLGNNTFNSVYEIIDRFTEDTILLSGSNNTKYNIVLRKL